VAFHHHAPPLGCRRAAATRQRSCAYMLHAARVAARAPRRYSLLEGSAAAAAAAVAAAWCSPGHLAAAAMAPPHLCCAGRSPACAHGAAAAVAARCPLQGRLHSPLAAPSSRIVRVPAPWGICAARAYGGSSDGGDSSDAAWVRQLRELQAYAASHGGSTDVPQKRPEYAQLREWVHSQRKLHARGRLLPAREAAMRALRCFDFAPPQQAAWTAFYEQLRGCAAAHDGTTAAPRSARPPPEEPALGECMATAGGLAASAAAASASVAAGRAAARARGGIGRAARRAGGARSG
jgi:hypothetical protein